MFSHPRTILLQEINIRESFVSWLSQEVLGPASQRWINSTVPSVNFSVIKALEIVSTLWPGIIMTGGASVTQQDYINKSFILSHDGPEFVNVAYVLLLGREPDASGRATFVKSSWSLEEKKAVITSIIESEEYMSLDRAMLLDESSERMEAVRTRSLRKSIVFRSGVVSEEFYSRKGISLEIGSGVATYSFLSHSHQGVGLTIGMMSFCEISGSSFYASQGWILAGPKCAISSGTYRLRVQIQNQRDLALCFDVCHSNGSICILRLQFCGSIDNELLFSVPAPCKDFEVRLRAIEARSGEIKVLKLEVQKDRNISL